MFLDWPGMRPSTLAALAFTFAASAAADDQSVCFGTVARGALEGGCELPADGANFTSYSALGRVLGRTFVHCLVRDIVVVAYRDLEASHGELRFVYGETGWKAGGEFKPHRTHQNGLSVDFFVPVRNERDKSVPLPTNILNKWGYDVEFSNEGRTDEYTIDFEALALHLAALNRAAKASGARLEKVILAPELQPRLKSAKAWREIATEIPLSPRPSWIRHDEHYHVDFAVPCQPLN